MVDTNSGKRDLSVARRRAHQAAPESTILRRGSLRPSGISIWRVECIDPYRRGSGLAVAVGPVSGGVEGDGVPVSVWKNSSTPGSGAAGLQGSGGGSDMEASSRRDMMRGMWGLTLPSPSFKGEPP